MPKGCRKKAQDRRKKVVSKNKNKKGLLRKERGGSQLESREELDNRCWKSTFHYWRDFVFIFVLLSARIVETSYF